MKLAHRRVNDGHLCAPARRGGGWRRDERIDLHVLRSPWRMRVVARDGRPGRIFPPHQLEWRRHRAHPSGLAVARMRSA